MELKTYTAINYGLAAFVIMATCLIIFWISTGTDAFSVDNKNYNSAKDNCEKLKQYLLDHYGEYNYDKAYARYGLICK